MHPKKELKIENKKKKVLKSLYDEINKLKATNKTRWLRLMYICILINIITIGIMWIFFCVILLRMISVYQ